MFRGHTNIRVLSRSAEAGYALPWYIEPCREDVRTDTSSRPTDGPAAGSRRHSFGIDGCVRAAINPSMLRTIPARPALSLWRLGWLSQHPCSPQPVC
ncbi:hypothetical protein CERSUDRAFT_87288 [Gelatoporia subvermispora B]|uniref:Uncharacterized protein n=1 Tax=Ceriporiopsis subvermispora (strain B) TaxID=914234 RepID=M2PCL1_CERS8|nr:hypothetical protein CERSUDRAFT_87288 [Gelatoporia subvermispora B]